MKNKTNICTVLFLFGLLYVGAQDIRFGAKAGFNLSSLGGDSRYNYASKPGFHVGGVAEIPFSDEIILQPEALFSFQGSGNLYTDKINLIYLNIPLMVKYNVWDKLYAEAGPQLGLLLSNNIDDDSYNTIGDPDVNSLDIGLAIGAGYRLDDNFYFQLRFNPGFVNVVKDYTSKNKVFQISAIYFL